MKKFKSKRRGYELEPRTFTGKSGHTYIVFRLRSGAFHVFVETQGKAAAKDCGVKSGTTRQRWGALWKRDSG